MSISTLGYQAKFSSPGGNNYATGISGESPAPTTNPSLADSSVTVTLSDKARAISLANPHQEPSDPRRINPQVDPDHDYGTEVKRRMEGLDYELSRNAITRTQYNKEMNFYQRLALTIA